MRAHIPYLARLALPAAGRATLQPSRPVFANDTYTPVLGPDAATPAAPGASADPVRDGGILAAPAASADPVPDAGGPADAPRAPAVGAPGAGISGAPSRALALSASGAGIRAAPAGPYVPGTAGIAPPPPLAPQIEFPLAAGTASAAPRTAGAVAHPARPLPPGGSRPEGEAAAEPSPGLSGGPLWGTPVELTRAIEPVPVTGETDRRAPAASRTLPGGLPSGPGRADAAGSSRSLGGDESAVSVTPGRHDAAAGPDRPGGPTAVRELAPPPGSVPRPIALPGPDPGRSHRAPNASGRARVSIGTIEVTVVPPARPAQEIRPPAPVPRGSSGPSSLLAATAGAGRLRDGLRRWYGTAQG